MKNISNWLASAMVVLASISMLSACSSDDSKKEESKPAGDLKTGDPCTEAQKDSCYGGLCLTGNTFAQLTDNHNEADIPGGYCSKLACSPKNTPEGQCGPGAFCFDLEQFVDTPLTACFKDCQSDDDCRKSEGYVCTDFSGTQYQPMARKACLPPSLLCLLDVAVPDLCPNAGPKDAGADTSTTDAGGGDSGATDSGADTGAGDSGTMDAGADTGAGDSGATDAGPADAATD